MNQVVVHINESMNETELGNLEQVVRQKTGVVSIDHHPARNHLLLVGYDNAITHSIDILKAFQNRGLQAQLIDM